MSDENLKIRATLTLRNEVMLAARARHRLTQQALADKASVRVELVCALESLDYWRFNGKNLAASAKWTERARDVAHALGVAFREVLPPELRGIRVRSTIGKILAVPPGRLLGLGAFSRSEGTADRVDVALMVREALDELPARDASLLRARFGIDEAPKTLEDIAARHSVTRERIRQKQIKIELELGRVMRRRGYEP